MNSGGSANTKTPLSETYRGMRHWLEKRLHVGASGIAPIRRHLIAPVGTAFKRLARPGEARFATRWRTLLRDQDFKRSSNASGCAQVLASAGKAPLLNSRRRPAF
jgi:hypothetical protein